MFTSPGVASESLERQWKPSMLVRPAAVKEQVGFNGAKGEANGAKGVALYDYSICYYILDLHVHLPLLLGGGIVDPKQI